MSETGTPAQTTAFHRALGSPSRVRLLTLLRERGPADASGLARAAHLHANTVRSHLDRLSQAGLVEAQPEPTGGRGRPRLVFAAVEEPAPEAVEEGYRLVADSLAGALLRRTPDGEPVDRVVRLLDELGFEPEREEPERVVMRACPLLAAGHGTPASVCPAHLGLVRDVLAGAGADVEPRLEPFAGPGVCVLHLPRRHP